MTLVPIWKKCPKCHRVYDWNPDVGILTCPYCSRGHKVIWDVLKTILGKK